MREALELAEATILGLTTITSKYHNADDALEIIRAALLKSDPMPRLVIEYHYDDGTVGVHPGETAEQALWRGFSCPEIHKPSHIVIRPTTSKGD